MKTVAFRGSAQEIPVGKILCLGRNYAAHAKEMNAETPTSPVVFLKPSTAIVHDGELVVAPPISRDLHHEIELVVMIGKEGKDVQREYAMEHVSGYAVGLDMTLRDVQAKAKKGGMPWSIAKGFDTSAPVSAFIPAREVSDPHSLDIALRVNGKVKQHSNTRNMIFRIEQVIAYCSSLFTLEPGDLIFTGTPEGVGKVNPGDELEAKIESVGKLRVHIR